MKLFSEHEVDIRMMKAGRRIRIVGTRPTIMLTVNDIFRGWFPDTDGALKAVEEQPFKSTHPTIHSTRA